MTKTKLTIIDRLNEQTIKNEIAKALVASKINPDEFLNNMLFDIQRNPALMECTLESILECAKDAAAFGLVPNKQLGHAYLVPYNNYDRRTKQTRKECTLQIGYKGYLKKLAEYGASIEVETVTIEEVEAGKFEEIRGSETKIIHKPIRKGMRTRENIALAYAIIKAPNVQDVVTVMTIEEIEEIAKVEVWDQAQGKKVTKQKGVWASTDRATDFGEMAKKTVIRRAIKVSNIDIVQKMNSYEGENEGRILKNVTDTSTNPNPKEEQVEQNSVDLATEEQIMDMYSLFEVKGVSGEDKQKWKAKYKVVEFEQLDKETMGRMLTYLSGLPDIIDVDVA